MNSTQAHAKTFLEALQATALEDMSSTSDQELMNEVAADGEDPHARVQALRTRFREQIARMAKFRPAEVEK